MYPVCSPYFLKKSISLLWSNLPFTTIGRKFKSIFGKGIESSIGNKSKYWDLVLIRFSFHSFLRSCQKPFLPHMITPLAKNKEKNSFLDIIWRYSLFIIWDKVIRMNKLIPFFNYHVNLAFVLLVQHFVIVFWRIFKLYRKVRRNQRMLKYFFFMFCKHCSKWTRNEINEFFYLQIIKFFKGKLL